MARKASAKGQQAKTAKTAPKAKKGAAKPKQARKRASAGAGSKKPTNAADALIGLLESPLVADLLAAAISAAAATAIEHKLKKGRGTKSLVRAVGAASAAAVGKQLAAELKEMRKAGKPAKGGK
jgi:hypothetical protein